MNDDDELPDLPAPPPEIVRDLAPPASLAVALRDIETRTVCGGRFAVEWGRNQAEPWRGKRLTMFCAEPLCIDTGECTGPRFVPHLDQFTHDQEDPRAKRRKITPEEAIAGARECAKRSPMRQDRRTDKQIARHIGLVWKKMVESLHRPGSWR